MTVGEVDSKQGQDELFRLAKGHYTTKALLALWRLGVLERAVDGEDVDVDAIAADGGMDAAKLRPLLEYLVVRGYFDRDASGRYRLTERGRRSGPYYGYLSTMVGAYEPVFTRIEDIVTGRAAYGKDIIRSHREVTRGLAALEDQLTGTVTDLVMEGRPRKVLDLGCGSAQLLAQICHLDANVQAVGVDIDPNSCQVARETVKRSGLEGRLTVIQGNAADVKTLPADVLAGVDTTMVMFLLHEMLSQRGVRGTAELVKDIATFMGPGGRLVMVEVSGSREHSYREDFLFVPEYELLHEYTNQRLAARSEWDAIMQEAGMRVEKVAPVNMCEAFCMVAVAEGSGEGTGEASH